MNASPTFSRRMVVFPSVLHLQEKHKLPGGRSATPTLGAISQSDQPSLAIGPSSQGYVQEQQLTDEHDPVDAVRKRFLRKNLEDLRKPNKQIRFAHFESNSIPWNNENTLVFYTNV